MTAKAAATDTNRKDGKLLAYPMLADEIIYKGSTVIGDATSRYAQTNDGTTITMANGDVFLGICAETADNSDGAAAAENVRVYRDGVHLLTFSDTLTIADLHKKVYINNTTDDAVVTVTAVTDAPELCIGEIVEFIDASHARVQIDKYVGGLATTTAS